MTTGGVPLIIDSRPAGEDLSASLFHWVKDDGSGNAILCTAVTDIPLGVLTNKPPDGGQAEFTVLGPAQIAADAALSAGDLIGPSADSKADAKIAGTDPTEYVCGSMRNAASGADIIADAYINCVNPHRAV
jgi:hypothetical protein